MGSCDLGDGLCYLLCSASCTGRCSLVVLIHSYALRCNGFRDRCRSSHILRCCGTRCLGRDCVLGKIGERLGNGSPSFLSSRSACRCGPCHRLRERDCATGRLPRMRRECPENFRGPRRVAFLIVSCRSWRIALCRSLVENRDPGPSDRGPGVDGGWHDHSRRSPGAGAGSGSPGRFGG